MLTIEKAREILGPEYKNATDKEIQHIIDRVSFVAKFAYDSYKKDISNKTINNNLKEENDLKTNKERHLANKMPPKATLDQKVKRHIEHVVHCKCRAMPEKIKKEIEKRLHS